MKKKYDDMGLPCSLNVPVIRCTWQRASNGREAYTDRWGHSIFIHQEMTTSDFSVSHWSCRYPSVPPSSLFRRPRPSTMLCPWHSLLSPTAPPATEARSPQHPPNRSLRSSLRPPPPRSVAARAAPTLSASATTAVSSSPPCPKKKVWCCLHSPPPSMWMTAPGDLTFCAFV